MTIELFVDEETKKKNAAEAEYKERKERALKSEKISQKISYMNVAIEICKARGEVDLDTIKRVTEELQVYFES